MRKLIMTEYVSLDGVVQAPGHPGEDGEGGFEKGGWTGPFMDDHREHIVEEFRAAGALLMGRVTYEIFASVWPEVPEEDEIARALNGLPKYVASTTLGEAEWRGTTVLKGDVAEEVAELKGQEGGEVLVLGSSGLAQTLIRHDLIDEYRLWLHPVVLGSRRARGRKAVVPGGWPRDAPEARGRQNDRQRPRYPHLPSGGRATVRGRAPRRARSGHATARESSGNRKFERRKERVRSGRRK